MRLLLSSARQTRHILSERNMKFEVYGPYTVPRNGRWVSRTRRDKSTFWQGVNENVACLPEACGCYLFAIRGRIWYVGLAECQSFEGECFSGHKVLQYNEALQRVNGNPSLFFIPKITPTGRFVRPSRNGHRDVRFLENLLIGIAIRRNGDLQNIRGTKLLREMNVPGILNTRRGQARWGAVQNMKRILGI